MLHSRTRVRVRGLVLAAICAAALGLAACGDDDDDTAAETTTTEAAETTTTDDSLETTTTDDSGETTTTDDSGETTETEGDIGEVLRSQLEAAGIQSSQADCVIDELEGTLDDETLEQLQSTEEPPKEVIDASMQAAQKCLTP